VDNRLRKKLDRLAKDYCANRIEDKCLLTGRKCIFSELHGSPTCKYMQEAVLPAHEVLAKEYYRSYGVKTNNDVKGCERCGTPFIKRSPAHKYCSDCSAEKVRQSKRESERKRRAKHGINMAKKFSNDADSIYS
jgi:hypothetical protein